MSSFYPGVTPADLIPGDPTALGEIVQRLNLHREPLSSTAEALQRIDTTGWEGQAATAFGKVLAPQPQRFVVAENQFATAQGAISSYRDTLSTSQETAARAIAVAEGRPPEDLLHVVERIVGNLLGHDRTSALLNEAEQMLAQARDSVEEAASWLGRVLHDAGEAALHPTIPGQSGRGYTTVTSPKSTGPALRVGSGGSTPGNLQEPTVDPQIPAADPPGHSSQGEQSTAATSPPKPSVATRTVPYVNQMTHGVFADPYTACGVAALAMVMQFFVPSVNPTLVEQDAMLTNVDDEDYMQWPPTFPWPPPPSSPTVGFTTTNHNNIGSEPDAVKVNLINEGLETGPVIVYLTVGGATHYVVITGGNSIATYTMNDPGITNGANVLFATGGHSPYSASEITQIVVVRPS